MNKKNNIDISHKKVVCVHLFNDYSGSPLVFSQAVKALIDDGYSVDLYTSKYPGEGFLSHIKGVNYNLINYNWSSNKIVTLIKLMFSQFILLCKLLKYRNTSAVIYINTVLPFGAALAGKLLRKNVIYHLHETSLKPAAWKNFLFSICNNTASKVIYVSDFLRLSQPLTKPNSLLISNALSLDFVKQSKGHQPQFSETFNVLMLASLKAYKGVLDFVQVAEQLPAVDFQLVLNADSDAVDKYFENHNLPSNLTVFPTQNNVHPFYQRAHLVLNLSHPDQWVETFGMTALEGMSYGLPVIVPPVGGISELVTDGYNGFKIDVREQSQLVAKIKELSSDEKYYYELSTNAREASEKYSMSVFQEEVVKAVMID